MQKSRCSQDGIVNKETDRAFVVIPPSIGFPHRPLSENGGMTAPIHPTMAPHQIDVTKSNRMCRLAASGSWTGFIVSHAALALAARSVRPSPVGGWSAPTTVFMVCLLAQDCRRQLELAPILP
jgi:hypothetical protein